MREFRINQLSILIFRILLSSVFIAAGIGHFLQTKIMSEKLSMAKMSFLVGWVSEVKALVILSGAGLLLGGFLLLLGFKTKVSSMFLVILIIIITITVQVGNPEGLGPLMKNIGLLGGLIFFSFNGGFQYSMDEIIKIKR